MEPDGAGLGLKKPFNKQDGFGYRSQARGNKNPTRTRSVAIPSILLLYAFYRQILIGVPTHRWVVVFGWFQSLLDLVINPVSSLSDLIWVSMDSFSLWFDLGFQVQFLVKSVLISDFVCKNQMNPKILKPR